MASTTSGIRSASDTGSPRRSAGASAARAIVEREHAAVAVERDDRIRQAGDDGVQCVTGSKRQA